MFVVFSLSQSLVASTTADMTADVTSSTAAAKAVRVCSAARFISVERSVEWLAMADVRASLWAREAASCSTDSFKERSVDEVSAVSASVSACA